MTYKRTRTKVVTAFGETETFEFSVVLHQVLALSPFSFVLVMDVLSENIMNEELWELLYADRLVITTENEEDLQGKVVKYQDSFEEVGLRIRFKTEAMLSSYESRDRKAINESRGSITK
ncbi:uncharacterized protein [Palaemon carinicauda]|uniref:uncharacterized protein n=1 Tax=Palaemon carinicauda TaxID=392227 RepID=UPI0035B68954